MTSILFPIYVLTLWIVLPLTILWYAIGRVQRMEPEERTDP
jgi:hypothetical protein